MTKFFIRSNSKATATLYTRVVRRGMGINWFIATGITVNVEAWEKSQKSTTAQQRYFSTDEGKKVQEQINLVSGIISDNLSKGNITSNNDKHLLDDAINDVINKEAIEAQEKVRVMEQEEKDNRLHQIREYYEDFMQRITSGDRLKKNGEQYRASSIRVWRDFGKYLKEYTPEGMTFEQIDRAFAEGFNKYLRNKGLMTESVNKYVLRYRALCNAAGEDGRNKNGVSFKVWREKVAKDNEKRAEIALSDAEISALYNMQLSGIREQVRDVWCMGFFSGQRVSDYANFNVDNFKTSTHDVKIITLRQVKTGNDVVVPVLDERVDELCKKYDYNFPKLTRRQINLYIKEVLHELSKDVPSLGEWVRTRLTNAEEEKERRYIAMTERIKNGDKLHGEEMKNYREMKVYADEHESGEMLFRRDYAGEVIRQRWELVCSHTARRSAVTSLFDTGLLDTRDIMSISGHTTQKHFEQYIRRGAIQQAERIAEKFKAAKVVNMKRKEA